MPSPELHSLVGKLQRDPFDGHDLSPAQSWLLDVGFSELEYRRRRALRGGTLGAACHCWLCRPGEYAVDPEA
jgi:hypothetical protein